MSDEIIVALIGLIGILITVVASARQTRNKIADELKAKNEEQNKEILIISDNLNLTQKILTEKIDHNQKILDLKIESIKQDQSEMWDTIKEHNDYAKHMPVIEEQIKVVNHRLADIEKQ